MDTEKTKLVNDDASRFETKKTTKVKLSKNKAAAIGIAVGSFAVGSGVAIAADILNDKQIDDTVKPDTDTSSQRQSTPVNENDTHDNDINDVNDINDSNEVVNDVNEVNDVNDTPVVNHVSDSIRSAHVDADNFSDAFAQARAQVGAGGVFEYDGKLYGTYTEAEWNNMTAQEKEDYQDRVYGFANRYTPHTHDADQPLDVDDQIFPETLGELKPDAYEEVEPDVYAETLPDDPTEIAVDETAVDATDEIAPDAEYVAVETTDDEIKVIGVEAVQTENGDTLNIAMVEREGDQALLVDLDNDGTIDVYVHDDNNDGEIQDAEIHDISEAEINVSDLARMHTDSGDDLLYASNDDMPDYINDADTSNFI